jgi:hypothetical protein
LTHFTHHSRCPKCADIGKDRNGNNLANYSDGSDYCFSCGYFSKSKGNVTHYEFTPKSIIFPSDATSSYPTQVKTYLDKYNLTSELCTKHLIMWSPYRDRLCFPFFDDTGLIGWQGRSFNPDKPKWFSQGDLKSIIHILGNQKSQQLILTEDIISSIVLSQFTKYYASPLFGSHLAIDKLQQYKLLNIDRFILWLDKDKEKESLKYSYKARQLGYDCISLVTDKDPKDYDKETLKKYLTERTKCATLN